eukprot:scaffold880_cov132-Cylindrotheca_fusiformis.AAC.75
MASPTTTPLVDMDSSSLFHSEIQESEDEVVNEALVPPPSSWFEGAGSIEDLPCTHGTNDWTLGQDEATATETDAAPPRRQVPINPTHYTPTQAVGFTHPSPSWKEISSQVLPAAARELLSSSLRRIYYTARLSYARGRWHRKYSDIGNNIGGYSLSSSMLGLPQNSSPLPPFSSLPWIDRQLVKEWRTYLPETPDELKDDEDFDFERARTLVPNPIPRPLWQKTDVCHECHKAFGPTRLRHHCRLCGNSFCHSHSSSAHSLPHLGYDPDVPERVCDSCKRMLLEQNLAERVAWRLARCRDFKERNLTPYFETGLDSAEEVALRITRAAIAMAKSIPLGAQATVAVETVDVLRKYGLQGIYGIMLRQEFLAAADLLRKALGINKTAWPLSVHELSAAIFYALAQHRAMRGLNPEREQIIHRLRPPAERGTKEDPKSIPPWTGGSRDPSLPNVLQSEEDNYELSALSFHSDPVIDATDTYNPSVSTIEHMTESFNSAQELRHQESNDSSGEEPTFKPVCDPVDDRDLASLVFYAPIALNFIYATKEVDMQLLAAQQGWRLLYAYLDQCTDLEQLADRPASAIFLHAEYKIACLAVRGTASINDVVTDIRQTPVPFPDSDPDQCSEKEDDWTNIFGGKGLALCGMASAAVNLFREHVDSLMSLAKDGYRIRLTGHSLGGGVATMMGTLILRHIEQYTDLPIKGKPVSNPEERDLLRVYAYGTPSCADAKFAESVDSFVTTAILHDDVFPRLTATSCRGLLKHLLHIRETWVKKHIGEDLRAVSQRARQAWAPRFRQPFALNVSSKSIKKYCKNQILKGKRKIASVTDNQPCGNFCESGDTETFVKDEESFSSEHDHWGERFFAPTSSLSLTQGFESRTEEEEDFVDAEEPKPQLLLEFLGGVDTRSEGIVIDGDEFFDTGHPLVESESDMSENSSSIDHFSDPAGSISGEVNTEVSDSWSLDLNPNPSSTNEGTEEESNDNEPSPVMLEETPLPRMFVPGRIIHVYSHRGVYKCAQVPRTFRELRRISLAGNMLSNHTAKSYYEGLLEVQTARTAPERPPRWTAFDEDDTCSCCASRFTWASTSNSEAQEARDKHNCRSCGGLVCDPCSRNRVPIPSIGITVPVRVCDRCYNDMGCPSGASSSLSSGFFAVEEYEQSVTEASLSRANHDDIDTHDDDSRPERQREKRSVVVDDLASRIRSSALTACR